MTADPPPHVYRCGNLEYTRRTLLALFGWLLWGDFCFTLMEAVVPSILPLKLRGLESSNWLIGLIMSTLPGIFNTTVCPWVSFKSDRHRGRFGRRIPFILGTLPFLAISLIMLGMGDGIGRWLHSVIFAGSSVRQASVIIVIIAVFAACFDLFNMFVASVYYYLFNDVVPPSHIGRFMAWFRAIGTLSGALYNYFVFKYAETHMREIFLGAALLYAVGFTLMCLRIKERDYPPPDDTGQKPSLLRDIRTFGRECYRNRFYWDTFLFTACSGVGNTIGVFGIFFSQSLGLDLGLIGKIAGISGIVTAVTMMFAGSLVDRWHPVRVAAYGAAMAAFFAFGNWIWLFAEIPSPQFYFWVALGGLPFGLVWRAVSMAAAYPRDMMIFPGERYGQFCGAQALVRAAATMVGGVLAGLYLDGVKHFFPQGKYAYRFIFVWSGMWTVAAFYFHYRSFRVWKRLGGEKTYTPPLQNCRLEDLPPRPDGAGINRGLLLLIGISACGGAVADIAYVVRYWLDGNAHFASLFTLHVALLAALFAVYLAFVRFMERP